MGKKLYVGNLAYSVTDSVCSKCSRPFGSVVSAQVIMDRDTGRSKGFGFVEMGSDQEASRDRRHERQGIRWPLADRQRGPTQDRGRRRRTRGGGGFGGGGGGGGRGGYGGGGGRR